MAKDLPTACWVLSQEHSPGPAEGAGHHSISTEWTEQSVSTPGATPAKPNVNEMTADAIAAEALRRARLTECRAKAPTGCPPIKTTTDMSETDYYRICTPDGSEVPVPAHEDAKPIAASMAAEMPTPAAIAGIAVRTRQAKANVLTFTICIVINR